MPRTNRITCAGCEKPINDSAVFGFGNSLFRVFLSARAMKKIHPNDPACRKCRSKFDNWTRKTKGDFDDLIGHNRLEAAAVSVFQ